MRLDNTTHFNSFVGVAIARNRRERRIARFSHTCAEYYTLVARLKDRNIPACCYWTSPDTAFIFEHTESYAEHAA